MKPYIIIESQKARVNELEAEVARLIEQGYEPVGGVAQTESGVWYQAMYRDPDLFDEREPPTTPKSHQDAVDDVILEAFYSDNYPGHPDYKGEVIRTDDQMEGTRKLDRQPWMQRPDPAAAHKVTDYISPANLTPAQRRKLSDWLDGKEGAKFPRMKAPDLRAVVNAMRQYVEQDGSRAEARRWEALWRQASEQANRALDMAHDRFTRLWALQRENDELRRERDEAIRRAERAEKRLEKEWWPNGRPAPEGSPILKGDKPINCYTSKESVDAISDDIRATDLQKGVGGGATTATEARTGGEKQATTVEMEMVTFSGGPLDEDDWFIRSDVERLVFRDENGERHTYKWTGWRWPVTGGRRRLFLHVQGDSDE